MRQKVTFESNGISLSGALEMPEQTPRAFALFAHCFTCGKDIAAASRIARALSAQGIAVLRFDFTGLGNSDGDFANTNFSSNVEDLVAAAEFLAQEYEAPSLLIGHSLGGAAVLMAAQRLDHVRGVVTIGAPLKADHVAHMFSAHAEEIESAGTAEVTLGLRQFTIKKQFLDDLAHHGSQEIERLRKPLLVMHAPLDDTVSIKEAEKIYQSAMHPKSFVSLDDADHLLSRARDAEYVAQTIVAWSSRYLPSPEAAPSRSVQHGHVLVSEKDHVFTQHVFSDTHHWLADEPLRVGGGNLGPDPYEHLLAALGTCTAMTVRMYARRKEIPLDHIEVALEHGHDHATDCEGCEEKPRRIEVIDRQIKLEGDLTDAQRQRLLEIADKCPVHRTLHAELEVRTQPA